MNFHGAQLYWRHLSQLQRGSLLFGLTFLTYLVLTAFNASYVKSSNRVLMSVTNENPISEKSQVFLQDFSRIMLRRGKKSLEVRAKSGKFLPLERVTYLSDAEVTVQRENSAPVKIRARNARLFMDGEQLRLANLEGAVVVEMNQGTEIHTELASYDAEAQMIRAPEAVSIQGQGYETTGDGMEVEVERDVVRLLRDVRSRFEKGAAIPKLKDTD